MSNFECHITIDPVEGEALDEVTKLAKNHHFKTCDEPLYSVRQQRNQAFITGHHHDYGEMFAKVLTLCRQLRDAGYPVRRYKIEEIRLDSKVSDILNMVERL